MKMLPISSRINKAFLVIAMLSFAALSFSCQKPAGPDDNGNGNSGNGNGNGSSDNGETPIEVIYEQFSDPKIDNGMELLAPATVNGAAVPVDTLRFVDGNGRPQWHLCCWNFDNKLSKGIRTSSNYGATFDDGTYMIARDDKGVITMNVFGSKAYVDNNGQPKHRKDGEAWINFLIETVFQNVELKNCKALVFSYDLKILKCENKMGDAYKTNIHAAQCLAYLFCLNNNPQSEDYMKHLWLGVGSFDNRDENGISEKPATSWDEGTATYIHSLADDKIFSPENLLTNEWHTCTVNVKNAIAEAIKALKANGYMKASVPDDFSITSMNFGWELPGTFDVTSQIRNISLKADADLQNISK